MQIHRVLFSLCLGSFAPPAAAQKVPEVRINLGTAAGGGHCSDPKLAATDATVCVAWMRLLSGGGRGVFCNRSLDAGATWLPADVRVDIANTQTNSFPPAIAAVQADVWVAWSSMPGIYCSHSLDGGASWPAVPTRVDHAPWMPQQSPPLVAASGRAVHVAWVDDRNGIGTLWCNRSLDGGSTWLANDVAVDVAGGVTFSPTAMALVSDGTAVFLTWIDRRHYPSSVYSSRSLDNGLTWLPGVRVDSRSTMFTIQCETPQLAVSGSTVHVAWTDDRNVGRDVFYNRSLDSGATWQPSDVRMNIGSAPGSSSCASPKLAVEGTRVYLTWEDPRSGFNDIYCTRSLDAGATWLPAERRVDTATPPGSRWSGVPQLAAAGNTVYVAWWEGIGGGDIYMNHSVDAGATWLPAEVRVDTGTSPGSHWSLAPQIALVGGAALVAWREYAIGSFNADVSFNLASGHQPYGTGTAGTNGLTPLLTGVGHSTLGSTVSLEFRGGLGSAPGVFAVGLGAASRIAQPLLGGTLLVAPSATYLFSLGGGPGAPGAGSAALPVFIPFGMGLLGLELNFQGLFLDAGAPGGVSMSNGLTCWTG